MADTAAAAADVQAPVPAAPAPAQVTTPGVRAAEMRSERRAAAVARMKENASRTSVADATVEKPAPVPAPAKTMDKPADKPAPTAAAAPKPAEPEKPDPATERGLRAIEQAKKKWLDEQNVAKAELEVQRAEIARLRKEAEGKVASKQELKKLSATELLEVLDHFNEDDFDLLSRASYARTKAGKVDPRAQAAAQEAARSGGSRAEVAQLKAQLAELQERSDKLEQELRGEFTKRDQASFAQRWVGEAIKALPTDKPTFIAKLHTNEPDKARRELLLIGAELEKANDGEPPTHAEVIDEFEKRKRAELTSLGLDPEALLAPPKPAEPAKPATRTLDVRTPSVVRPENAPKTMEERRENAIAKLRARKRATADET